MSDMGTPKTAFVISSSLVATTSSLIYAMARGPSSYQLTIIASGTGTATFTGIATVNMTNDEIGYIPYGTVTALGTYATVSTGIVGTSTAAASFFSGTNYPYRGAKMIITTLTTGVGAVASGMITQ